MIFFWRAFATKHVDHLAAEVAFWRTQYQHERQRAELLTDRLLAQAAIPSVTMPLLPDKPVDPIGEQLAKLLQTQDFVGAGRE